MRGTEGLRFLARNLRRIRTLPTIPSTEISGGILVRAYHRDDNAAVDAMYRDYIGCHLSRLTKILLSLAGSRLCLVGQDRSGNVVGMELFYFNARDVRENTIHEGFISVAPQARGKNMASAMRRHSLGHFRKAGLAGVSSRIRADNPASLKSARAVGFSIVEQRGDEFYLVATDVPKTTAYECGAR